MTDLQLQFAIEYEMRRRGSIGPFRAFGSNMEVFMGTILAGDNAAEPSPFDYALGGGGANGTTPIGADGTVLRDGMTVMVDMAGNYTPYITDLTRTFSVGELPDEAYRAHQVSVDIVNSIVNSAGPGTLCSDLYDTAAAMARDAGLAGCFMGTKQQARFVGHGIGLHINEQPVLTPRSREVLEPNMAFALEPKFIVEGVGAVGIEDSLLVTDSGIERLTEFRTDIIPLK